MRALTSEELKAWRKKVNHNQRTNPRNYQYGAHTMRPRVAKSERVGDVVVEGEDAVAFQKAPNPRSPRGREKEIFQRLNQQMLTGHMEIVKQLRQLRPSLTAHLSDGQIADWVSEKAKESVNRVYRSKVNLKPTRDLAREAKGKP